MSNRASAHIFWFLMVIAAAGGSFYGGVRYHQWRVFGQSEYSVKIVDVVDGDTVDVTWFGGVARVRIVGIDTFETSKNKKLNDQAAMWKMPADRAYQLGNQAKEVATKALRDRTVVIKFPAGKVQRDAFGRLLAYVYIDGVDFGKRLIEEGLAYTRPEEHLRERFYQWPVIQAQNDKKGMWAVTTVR